MTLEMILIIAVWFVVLLFTHYLALKVGWRMGSKTEPSATFTMPALKKDKGSNQAVTDIYDEERIDVD